MTQEEADLYWKIRLKDEQPIRQDFQELGFKIEYLHDLGFYYPDYASAIDVIYSHLDRDYSDRTNEDLARLLGHPAAFFLWRELLALYRNTNEDSNPHLMDGLAVALSEQLVKSKSPELRREIIELLRDKSRGQSRIFFLDFFRRKRDKESLDLVNELKDDPDLRKEILSWKK